jgi:hypothetical protein
MDKIFSIIMVLKLLKIGRRSFLFILLLMGYVILLQITFASTSTATYVDQGSNWPAENPNRVIFYSQDQGSQLMPIKWFLALKQPGKELLFADSLTHYGYLSNELDPSSKLPIGFSVNNGFVGMTCAACHTRQIKVDNILYRIDGGPAIVDFQSFTSDLDKAVNSVLTVQNNFDDFAKRVLGASLSQDKKNKLRNELIDWYKPYHTIMSYALPVKNPWGPARLDAVGMIFNRLTGLDIGTNSDHIIISNFHLADAPVRYPYIWNAPKQDKTQWPGFADNGNNLLGLSRNLGEVLGVFAQFYPQKDNWRILGIDYIQNNSANFDGLDELEDLVKKIGPPKWPWKTDPNSIKADPKSINTTLAKEGRLIFESSTKTESGGCIGCHGIRRGAFRSVDETWETPLCYVETDIRQFNLLNWKVKTGILSGSRIPFLKDPLQEDNESPLNVLGLAVIGSILQQKTTIAADLEVNAFKQARNTELYTEAYKKRQQIVKDLSTMQNIYKSYDNMMLEGAFQTSQIDLDKAKHQKISCKKNFKDEEPMIGYESRVLEGIWATAPYLHNGSVPTLADLLKPVKERPVSFKVGQAYDLEKIGLAVEQNQFNYTYQTTDCSELASGNSRCGHEFGTKLTDEEKKALLEYLKTL